MIKIITTITNPKIKFNSKEEFKNFFATNLANEKTDPLRVYNFKLMEKYGEKFFYLIFEKPNTGRLNHIYLTEEEYLESIPLRNAQKHKFENLGILYHVSEPQIINDRVMTKEEYYSLHTHNLVPLDIKIDVDHFLLEIEKYPNYFQRWGDKYKEYPRYAIPLVNLNGKIDNIDDPACYPLDRWNFLQKNIEKTPENFTNFIQNISHFEKDNLFEYDFTVKTELMDLSSLKPLNKIKEFMTRSCILKWDTMGHLLPHFDTWHPAKWLRLWGTTNPENMRLRYKIKGVKGNTINKITGDMEHYETEKNIEPGRLYLHDSLQWHDAFAIEDNVYQFFISLNLNSIDTIRKSMRI